MIISILLLLAAFIVNVHPQGVCYDPHHIKGPVTEESLRDDFILIRKYFRAVRTYEAETGSIPLGPLIGAIGLKMTLGIDMRKSMDTELAALRAALNDDRSSGRILQVMVGNENLGFHKAHSIGEAIKRVKYELRKHGRSDIPVGTVQTPAAWLHSTDDNLEQLVDQCDVLGANIYPFFSTLHESPIDNLEKQWNWIRKKYTNKKLILGETGWASNGKVSSGNEASLEKQKDYFHSYISTWFKKDMPGSGTNRDFMNYFQFFNQDYKIKQGQQEYEAHFGLAYSNGVLKHSGAMPDGLGAQTVAPTRPLTHSPRLTPQPSPSVKANISGDSHSSSDEGSTRIEDPSNSSSSSKGRENESSLSPTPIHKNGTKKPSQKEKLIDKKIIPNSQECLICLSQFLYLIPFFLYLHF